MNNIAIIGTAGRDKTKRMDLVLWQRMLNHALINIPRGSHVVSGGAAWADHLAVVLFMRGHAKGLTLHLPAPFRGGCFKGPSKSSASAANWYHQKFSEAVGIDSLADIDMALRVLRCEHTCEPSQIGFGGMFARNAKVAADADIVYAYTFGEGDEPADGGTKHTWDLCKGKRTHVSLPLSLDLIIEDMDL